MTTPPPTPPGPPGVDTDSSRPTRVLLIDDDELVRAGIAGILATVPDLTVVAQASDGRAGLVAARKHLIDVALVDIRMPHLDGLRTLAQLRTDHPDLPVAMLTTFSDEEYISEAVSLGALGFLLKSDSPQELISAVRALVRGGAAFSPRVARWLIRNEAVTNSRRAVQARTSIRELTPRQRQLLAAIGQGRSNAEIARTLHLSEGTVKQYLTTLFAQLSIGNRVQAAILAHEAGILDQERDCPETIL